MKIAICDDDRQMLIQIRQLVDEYLSCDMPVSTEKNHGLGTKSIASVEQKYNGVYSFTAEKESFTTSIIL